VCHPQGAGAGELAVTQALYYLNLLFLAYFVLVNGIYLLLVLLSSPVMMRQVRMSLVTKRGITFSDSFCEPVTVIIPAHNEAATIADSVSSVLAVRYPEMEVVVVNDGSTDETLEELTQSFGLVPSAVTAHYETPCGEIRGMYESVTCPGLQVVDKERGGKADALNAGINASTFPLVCSIDADSIIDARSIVRITRPFLEDHRVVAAGGVVMLANGCDIEKGEVKQARVARSWLAKFQTIEYLRAFLFGRVGWSRLNSLMIVSGAFSIFRRTALIEVGGYCVDSVGEDMEIVLRMHRVFTDRNRAYRVVFVPDPICWTHAPETLKGLSAQRRRWQRGLADSLVRNRQLCLNPKYGGVGLVGYPFFLAGEMLSPLVELLGYAVIVAAILLHAISWQLSLGILAIALLLAAISTMTALLLEARSFCRYSGQRSALVLSLCALLEAFGYRQLNVLWRVRGLIDYLRRRRFWNQPEGRTLKVGSGTAG
jgi:cellulose synthase/poly-beta-1,6-N-acetylglucosamine synthase-like glycosyltransferase